MLSIISGRKRCHGINSIHLSSQSNTNTACISPTTLTIEGGGGGGGGGGADVVSYPDPDSHSCGWITSPPRSGDVIHPQLWESGSGYETRGEGGGRRGVGGERTRKRHISEQS